MNKLLVVGCVILIASCIVGCFADVYMHNPRGSNDRLNEQSADRQQETRLFNSQNNARGGYCWGPPLSYYAGSKLSIEWTAQHACGNGNVKCNYVLQYMCGYSDGPEDIRIRDGTTTTPIPDDVNNFNATNDDGTFTFGMHESYSYYQSCKSRYRNAGLFTADQNVGTVPGASATRTRQNNGGQKYGFECPEERDYYPYWAPSPWKDIAVLTPNSGKMCPYYQKESQNVAAKYYCAGKPAINQQECASTGGTWTSTPAWGIAKPDCGEPPYSRDNHLGNSLGGYTNSYNWTIPTSTTEKCVIGDKCVCVLRLRYNITTYETDGYGMEDGAFDDSSLNTKPPLPADPNVMVGGKNLSLTVNTNQYPRTFQDRSHIFTIKQRPKNIPDSVNIWNLNVRGKRGNIVQVYPATEYDFTPSVLSVTVGDYVHFQWTGCDTNPQNNDGEGIDGTDRSNMVQINYAGLNHPITDSDWASEQFKNFPKLFTDSNQRYMMAHIAQPEDQCASYADLLTKNNNDENKIDQDPTNCMKLNAAPTPYFDGGLVKVTTQGEFHYMSTRNNNFSNRTQKGILVVNPLLPAYAVALIVIGGVAVASAASIGGLMFYARKHPHSAVASKVDSAMLKIKSFKWRS